MSISLATRGVIGGFTAGGGSGEPIYVDFPVCSTEPEAEELGAVNLTARDPNAVAAIPSPVVDGIAVPRRRSEVEILPTKNVY